MATPIEDVLVLTKSDFWKVRFLLLGLAFCQSLDIGVLIVALSSGVYH